MTRRTPTPTPLTPPGGVTRYRDRILDDLRHDPYQAKEKYEGPATCGICHLVYQDGRWTQGDVVAGARSVTCPACRRIADKLPAGFVTIAGPFASEHRAEVTALVRNTAAKEQQEHPLHRVIAIEEGPDAMLVTTTDVHLPRRIGEALERAYDGILDLQQSPDEYLLRVHWSR